MARTVAVLIFPDFQLLDAAGPIAAFEEARDETAAAGVPAEGDRSYRRAGSQFVRRAAGRGGVYR